MEIERLHPDLDGIVPQHPSIERIVAGAIFGEGPVWNAKEGYLLWTDAYQDKIFKWTPGQGVTTFLDHSGQALALTYDREGRLVATGWSSRNIWRMEHDGRIVVLASHYGGKKINTPNDLVVSSDGSIYWTDTTGGLLIPFFRPEDCQKYLDFNAVFHLSPDGSTLTPVIMDEASANGLALSPDESLLYVNYSLARNIRVFDVQPDGTVRNGRLFYQDTGREPGIPDGMKVDIEGNIYCRASGGIQVIDSSGRLLGRLKQSGVSNLAWGDADWRTLYITGHSDVYRIRLNIPGVPVGIAA
ncbi:MAG: SMP-30/gluconolactonase/LRE family protein [Chloroflexi bacterium]|nr:SMP-30/gluconolactonase/LRE family protein [Chloroflexota bacterium]